MWMIQIKGLAATGLLALFGLKIICFGFTDSDLMTYKWSAYFGRVIIGGIFIIPFVAVLISVISSHRQ